MTKKRYSGLEAEFISFGEKNISTLTHIIYSGCKLGAVTFYTEDEEGKPMMWGQCWYSNPYEDLDFDYTSYDGYIIP